MKRNEKCDQKQNHAEGNLKKKKRALSQPRHTFRQEGEKGNDSGGIEIRQTQRIARNVVVGGTSYGTIRP